MLSTILIVLPIFALIFAGWFVRRIGIFGPNATSELNRYVVYLALPALLFDIIAHVHWTEIWQPGFIAVFSLSTFFVLAVTVVTRVRQTRHLADATIDALAASYGNTAYMGFPLGLMTLGEASLAPTTIATIITVCISFAFAITLIEIGLQTEARRLHVAMKVTGSLLKNPLIFAPALAALVPLAGLDVPAPVETFLKMLGGSASPCALVGLGLFLAEKRRPAERDNGEISDHVKPLSSTVLLVGLKLFVQPVLAGLLAGYVFRLSGALTHAAILLSALPTGTGPFMLAEFYHREAHITSKVILVATLLSILTVSGYLALVR